MSIIQSLTRPGFGSPSAIRANDLHNTPSTWQHNNKTFNSQIKLSKQTCNYQSI